MDGICVMMTNEEMEFICDVMWQSDISNKAIQIVKEALKKQIPKKPKCYEDKYMHCAKCNEFLGYKYMKYPTERNIIMFEETKHCWECGQLQDWSEL